MRSVIGVVIMFPFACSGTSTPAPVVCGLVAADGQLDTQAATTLVVAPDERHVAYLRDPHTIDAGCIHRGERLELGTLVALELQSDGSACQRAIAHDVSPYSIYYSADSRALAWTQDVNDCGVGRLKTADSDGSNVRWVHGSVLTDYVIGSTVFFTVEGQNRDWAAPMAGGWTISLGKQVNFEDIRSDSNATGTAVAHRKYGSDQSFPEALVLFQLPSGKSQTLVDGVAEAVGNRIWSPGGNWLAFCHGPKGTGAPASLSLVAADGSTRIDVSSHPDCWAFTFSPDDAWLAYADLDASGGTRLLTYSLKDRSSIELGMLAPGYFSLAFSDDGASVVATVDSTQTSAATIYAATTGVAGSLQFLTKTTVRPESIVSAGDHVAVATVRFAVVPTGDRKTEVYPVSGGDPVTIPGSTPLFEPGVAQPHLLLRQYPPSTISIAATDGTAVTSIPVPDYISFASWLGSAAVYGTRPDWTTPLTITALTNAGAITTPLASEVGSYAWAEIPTPTRLFYSREVESAVGPAGVFYVDLPR